MKLQVQKSFTTSGSPHRYGTLYLVGTPIGHLEDMTFRAISTLQEVSLIAAEDTRQTRKLLTHFQIATKIISYYRHNQASQGAKIIEILQSGQSVALVSDAGLPTISDPGYELVQMAVSHEITVVPIPGANAALTALIASGITPAPFIFHGFLPRQTSTLTKQLQQLKHKNETMIFYESPHRIIKTIKTMEEAFGSNRMMCVARELTKTYEEFIRGSISDCVTFLKTHPPRGEYCIVIEGYPSELSHEEEAWWESLSIDEHIEHYVQQGETKKEAIKRVAQDRHLPKRSIYQTQINDKQKEKL